MLLSNEISCSSVHLSTLCGSSGTFTLEGLVVPLTGRSLASAGGVDVVLDGRRVFFLGAMAEYSLGTASHLAGRL